MTVMEYQSFAKYYDIFYQNKDYKNEVNFLMNFIQKEDKIIDIGCGTGIHAFIMQQGGYQVDGLDCSVEMLYIAKKRVHSNLYL